MNLVPLGLSFLAISASLAIPQKKGQVSIRLE